MVMEKTLIFLGVILIVVNVQGQVGIGTTSPTEAAMLEVSSQTSGAGPFRGFMPPRVLDISARNSINATSIDVGLLVFVENIGCLQLWNGSGWESIHCTNTSGSVNLFQNFDLNTTWGYISDVPFFDNGPQGFYGITDASNGIFSNITTLTNNFLGILDLNDTESGNGTPNFATITFNTINVSSASNGLTLTFNYEFFEFDGGDSAYYTVVIDGMAQPEVLLLEGETGGGTGISLAGTVSETIPPGTTMISLRLRIKQNGQSDVAGFDNFALVAN